MLEPLCCNRDLPLHHKRQFWVKIDGPAAHRAGPVCTPYLTEWCTAANWRSVPGASNPTRVA